MTRDEKLASLGYPLDRIGGPGAIYRTVVVDGTTVYVSGCIPNDGPDNLTSQGKVPSQVSLEAAQKAAALCAANILRHVRKEVGSLEKIDRVLKLVGFVNTDTDFTDQHLVINGASNLVREVFGDAGTHARTALGLQQLPLGCSVEVEMILKLK